MEFSSNGREIGKEAAEDFPWRFGKFNVLVSKSVVTCNIAKRLSLYPG